MKNHLHAAQKMALISAISSALVFAPHGAGAAAPGMVVPNANSGMIPNANSGPIPNSKSGMITNPDVAAMPNTKPANANLNGRKARWNMENRYWRTHFAAQPYANGADYSVYQPAYRFGVTAFNQYGGQPFNSLSQSQLSQMQADWTHTHANFPLGWEQAEDAVRDAYNRLYDERNAGAAQPIADR